MPQPQALGAPEILRGAAAEGRPTSAHPMAHAVTQPLEEQLNLLAEALRGLPMTAPWAVVVAALRVRLAATRWAVAVAVLRALLAATRWAMDETPPRALLAAARWVVGMAAPRVLLGVTPSGMAGTARQVPLAA